MEPAGSADSRIDATSLNAFKNSFSRISDNWMGLPVFMN